MSLAEMLNVTTPTDREIVITRAFDAPRAGAAIGLVLTSAGVIAAMQMDVGPLWYPIALAISTLPTAWLGGTLYLRRHVSA